MPSRCKSKKRCFKCEQWKDLSLFNKNPKLSGGVNKLCRECHNNHDAVKRCEANRREKRKRSFNENFPKYVDHRVKSIKSNCKRKGIPFGTPFLDLEHLPFFKVYETKILPKVSLLIIYYSLPTQRNLFIILFVLIQKIDISYLFNKKKLWKTMLLNMDKWSLIYPTML